MNQHSNNRPQQEKKPTTFSTPEKQQRYRQLWQRASTAAEAEVQAVKDGNPSVVVICPAEVIQSFVPTDEADDQADNSPDTPPTTAPPNPAKIGLTLATLVSAATLTAVRFALAYRKVARI